MGSVCDAIEEAIDYANANGKKTGLVVVRLYRPFSRKYFLEALPDTVKKIAVLDRTKEPGSMGEPLLLDVTAAIKDSKFNDVLVTGGRYGLGSKDTQPQDLLAVYENLWSDHPKKEFTISITDDVTGLSLPPSESRTANLQARFPANSGDWDLTVLLVRIRTVSRSSVTIRINMHRRTSSTTRKNPVVSLSATCGSEMRKSNLPTM